MRRVPAALTGRAPERTRLRRVAANAWGTVRVAWAAEPRMALLIMAGTGLSALVPPATLLLTGLFIDGIAHQPAKLTEPVLLWPLIGLASVAVVSGSIGTAVDHAQVLFQERVHMAARFRFLRHLASSDLSLLEDPTWRDRLQRARADVGWRPYAMTSTLVSVFASVITLGSLLSALAVLEPVLLLFGVLNVLPPIVLRYRVNQRLYQLHWTTTRREREHNYLVNVASEPGYAKEVRGLLLGSHVLDRAQTLSESRLTEQRAIFRHANLVDLFAGVLSSTLLVAAYLTMSQSALTGGLSLGQVAAVIGAFAAVTGHLTSLLSALVSIDQHGQFLDDYFSFLATEPSVKAPEQPRALPAILERITFEQVRFRYPGAAHEAVRGVDFELRRGKTIALVGENGAGKSTLVKLLLRFFDVSAGAITVDGIDIRELDPRAWRQRVGVLFQDFANYELEIRDGLHFGRLERDFDEPRAQEALRGSRADQVVQSVDGGKHGLHTAVGRVLDGGHELSGGQWQRLALARLLYRDADVWILDEPTANLDPESEMKMFEELRNVTRDKMAIIISHRFSTVRTADEILVVVDGTVVERGRHDELMARCGRYAELFELQAQSYR